jgi:hypothetical protein
MQQLQIAVDKAFGLQCHAGLPRPPVPALPTAALCVSQVRWYPSATIVLHYLSIIPSHSDPDCMRGITKVLHLVFHSIIDSERFGLNDFDLSAFPC